MSPPTAVVVEDDKLLGEVYRDVLTMCGFNTQHIIDSQLAMDAIRTTLPTLVMLDLNLSRVSGVEILLRIREDETLKDIRVIVATGSSYAVQDEMINKHADIVLFKPISIQQIIDFVSRIKHSESSPVSADQPHSTHDAAPSAPSKEAVVPAVDSPVPDIDASPSTDLPTSDVDV